MTEVPAGLCLYVCWEKKDNRIINRNLVAGMECRVDPIIFVFTVSLPSLGAGMIR